MKPCIESELDELLNECGFTTKTTFWQMFNFKAIIAIK